MRLSKAVCNVGLSIVASMALSFVFTASGAGQHDPKEPQPKAVDEHADEKEMHVELIDEPFNRFVDLDQVRKALMDKDASRLTDAALLMAEGERRLLRPHKALPAKILFEKAVRLASEQSDKDSLDRLARASKALNLPDLDEMLLAEKLRAKSRKTGPTITLNVAIDPLNADQWEVFQTYAGILRDAIPKGRKGILLAMAEGLDEESYFNEATRKGLLKYIQEQLKVMPAEVAEEEPDVLDKLMMGTRSSSGSGGNTTTGSTVCYGVNCRVWNFCNRKLGTSVGGGECAHLVSAALTDAGALPRGSDAPGKDDYVWGIPMRHVTKSNGRITGWAHAGDLVQFRNAWFKYPSGATSTCFHHSAVVHSVAGNGRLLTVFEQGNNKNAAGVVLSHKNSKLSTYDLGVLQAGTENHPKATAAQKGPGFVRIFAPIPKNGATFYVKNQSGQSKTYSVNNTQYTLANGATKTHSGWFTSLPILRCILGSNTRTSGGIVIEDSEIYQAIAVDGRIYKLLANDVQ